MEEQSLDEPSNVEFSEDLSHVELNDPISDESFLNLTLTLPISPISSTLPPFLPSLSPPESTFIEFETFVHRSPFLYQTLCDSDLGRL